MVLAMTAVLLTSVARLPAAGQSGPIFVDATSRAGVGFVHFNGMTGEYTLPEITGSGAALLDYDLDGDLDLYMVQGALIGAGKKMSDAVFPWKGEVPPLDRLYRNDLIGAGAGALRFTDVTEASGIREDGYGMGVAVGDYDRDGYPDLYVTNVGSNRLLHNNGDGTFTDVTAAAGVDDVRWSTSASWVDYDGDGWLDLYVANYVSYKPNDGIRCFATSSARDYCGPDAYDAQPDRLLRNLHDGRFEDVSAAAGLSHELGAGLGVVTSDLTGDGRIDIYVANDGDANLLWTFSSSAGFSNEALWTGTAINGKGMPEASMGVDSGDYDGDGDDDLFMTHIMGETNTLFANMGDGMFEDRTIAAGLAGVSLGLTAFGTGWIDYDNDGWLDIMVLNGAVLILEDRARDGDLYPLDQANMLLHNNGRGAFGKVGPEAGPAFEAEEVSRGLAFGDVDNDGDMDMVVANNNGPARLLLNQVGARNHWCGLDLEQQVGTGTRPIKAPGARVQLRTSSGRVLTRQSRTDGTYCSARDPRVLIGLGPSAAGTGKAAGPPAVERVTVRWPDGSSESWTGVPIDRYTVLRKGTGSTTNSTTKESKQGGAG
jgi:hypothetical protein